MCAALLSTGDDDLIRFVAAERKRDALAATYVGFIRPVDISLLPNDGMKPPEATKKRGRPKKNRIPSCVEQRQKRLILAAVVMPAVTTPDLAKSR